MPPLWRDVDAYIQLTENPAISAYWGHDALYCIFVRLPLFLSYEPQHAAGAQGPARFFIHPVLTDPGIYCTIILQHILLCSAALYLIVTLTQSLVARQILAVCFAANPISYTFAQSVGSESLSAVLILFFATAGWRLLFATNVGAKNWVAFAIAFTLVRSRATPICFSR